MIALDNNIRWMIFGIAAVVFVFAVAAKLRKDWRSIGKTTPRQVFRSNLKHAALAFVVMWLCVFATSTVRKCTPAQPCGEPAAMTKK
jgi:hypothetical protein